MKRAFPIVLMIMGFVFLIAGAYTINRGIDARHEVKAQLVAQNIVTTPDAEIPNVKVTSARTAQVMADVINKHQLEATKGQTYSEMGRFLDKNGNPTSDQTKAALNAAGRPVTNPLRDVAFQASALRTSLYASVMAFNISDLVVGLGVLMLALGLAVGGLGVALGALVIPSLAERAHVRPVTA